MGLSIVIVDGRDAWMVAELLKENSVPVILRETQNLPARVDSDVDQPFKTPAQLQETGVLFCFSSDGYWQQRNLAFQAGKVVPMGTELRGCRGGTDVQHRQDTGDR